MKKQISIITSIILLSGLITSCSNVDIKSNNIDNIKNNNIQTNIKKETTISSGSIVELSFIGKLSNGEIIDSSGTGNIIIDMSKQELNPLIESKILGHKAGDNIELIVEPKDAFGEKMLENIIPKNQFEDNIEQVVPKKFFNEVIEQKIPKKELDKEYKIGDNIEIIPGKLNGIVVNQDEDTYIVNIENKNAPFKGKELKVGLKDTLDNGAIIEITKIDGDNITTKVENVDNPFYKKELKVGLKGFLKAINEEVEVVNIGENNVTIRYKNPNKYAGEKIIYDIKIYSIK